jgi:hypothetical protein
MQQESVWLRSLTSDDKPYTANAGLHFGLFPPQVLWFRDINSRLGFHKSNCYISPCFPLTISLVVIYWYCGFIYFHWYEFLLPHWWCNG